jgi:acyl-CoA synthetase (AMP-forming)/AMP-acid ligase II
MKMPITKPSNLWHHLSASTDLSDRWLRGEQKSVNLGTLRHRSGFRSGVDKLRGISILIRTEDQLAAALTMIELDGIAGRMVLCPPDFQEKDVAYVLNAAAADMIVYERPAPTRGRDGGALEEYDTDCPHSAPSRDGNQATEWILLTSGTSGLPKLVVHTFLTLTGAITGHGGAGASSPVWSTFYDIRRYGGLQIFLRAMLGPGSMVLSSGHEPSAEFLARAGVYGVTHISGTPSHWRAALMSGSAGKISPRYIRLSGEIADQTILDGLRATYPNAEIAHAFASTEAGVAFDVRDGLAGFPTSFVEKEGPEVKMLIVDGSLCIRSNRNAIRYLGDEVGPLVGSEGFVDTGDMVELRRDRYYFAGRRTGVINVGGFKVHPEEVEAVINRHPGVRMSLVTARPNPITGAVVSADVVMKLHRNSGSTESLREEILIVCRSALPRYKVPAVIRFVPSLRLSGAGKLVRSHA